MKINVADKFIKKKKKKYIPPTGTKLRSSFSTMGAKVNPFDPIEYTEGIYSIVQVDTVVLGLRSHVLRINSETIW